MPKRNEALKNSPLGQVPTEIPAELQNSVHPSLVLPSHLRLAARVANQNGLEEHLGAKARFEAALQLRLGEPERKNFRETLEALRFIDHAHVALNLLDAYLSNGAVKITELLISRQYDEPESEIASAYTNFHKAARYLKGYTGSASLKRLLSVHRITMAGGIEELETSKLGKVRDRAVWGDETSVGITTTQLRAISKNCYLTFKDCRPSEGDGPSKRHFGSIIYPDPRSIGVEALTRIEKSAPEVYRDVKAYQTRESSAPGATSPSQVARLTRRLVTALADERYNFFNAEVEKIGALDSPKKVLDFIKLVAYHYRDIISIHPVENGNGRTCRLECLYDPLDKVGISRPRLNDPDTDILFSPSAWLREVQRGIVSNDQLYADLTLRLELGVPLETSPDLVFPGYPREVGVELRAEGRKKVHRNIGLLPTDGKQYGAYVKARLELDSKLMIEFNRDPIATGLRLRDEFKQHIKATLCLCDRLKGGREVVGISLVDPDFEESFGNHLADRKPRWDAKIAAWYRPDLIWRGLPYPDKALSDQDILRIFSKLGVQTVAQNILSHWPRNPTHSTLVGKVRLEFQRYNKDLLSGDLFHMAQDHIDCNLLYDSSYGLSTSKDWLAGRRFARGFLSLSKDDGYKSMQDQLKSRIIIGSFRALKDVDLTRLKMLDPRFSNTAGRQQEVLAIGGIDPDSIMVIHEIDAKGGVSRSFVRNREIPNEIWEVKGKFNPALESFVELEKTQVTKVHQIV